MSNTMYYARLFGQPFVTLKQRLGLIGATPCRQRVEHSGSCSALRHGLGFGLSYDPSLTCWCLGGTGFWAATWSRQLAARGMHVRVPTRNRERAKQLILLPTVDVVQGRRPRSDDPATA